MAELRLPRINSVILSGRLVSDAEVRYSPDGRGFLRMRLANTTVYRTGAEWKEDTLFIDVLYSAKSYPNVEEASRRLTKGTPVIVEGRLRYREWESEGMRRHTYEIRAYRVHILEKKDLEELSELDEGESLPPEGGLPF